MSNEKASPAQSPIWIWAALSSTLLSVCTHIYLYSNHLEVLAGTGAGSVCDISEKFSCTAVAASQYSSIKGVPVAMLGAMANFFLLILLVMHKMFSSDRADALKSFWLSIAIALGSVVMAAISFTQMNVYCPFCIALYVFSFITAASLWIYTKGSTPKEKTSPVKAGLFLLGILFFGWLSHSIVMQRTGLDETEKIESASLQEWSANPQYDFSALKGIEFGASAESAKLTIVEFADFLCSHCQTAAPILHNFVKSKPDVRLVFFTFPLDGCNEGPTGLGPSCKMAKTAFCAMEQGQGPQSHEWIFKNIVGVRTPTEAEDKVNQIQNELSLDKETFKKCFDSKDTVQSVQRFISAGKSAGVRGTPAIFVNGRILPLAQRTTVLEKAYQSIK